MQSFSYIQSCSRPISLLSLQNSVISKFSTLHFKINYYSNLNKMTFSFHLKYFYINIHMYILKYFHRYVNIHTVSGCPLRTRNIFQQEFYIHILYTLSLRQLITTVVIKIYTMTQSCFPSCLNLTCSKETSFFPSQIKHFKLYNFHRNKASQAQYSKWSLKATNICYSETVNEGLLI